MNKNIHTFSVEYDLSLNSFAKARASVVENSCDINFSP